MLIIWDSKNKVSDSSYNDYYFWDGYEESSRRFSLLKYIDEHDHLIKEYYLSLIHEIGEYKVGGISVIDLLQIERDFSYWWMTSLVEKSPWKQKSILTVLKLFAIEQILNSGQYSSLRLVGSDNSVAKVIKNLCEKKSISFHFEQTNSVNVSCGCRIKSSCIGFITESFLVVVKYIITLIKQRNPKGLVWHNSEKSVFFCSYLFNLDNKLLEKGIFYTRFWESLHKLIPQMGLKANWLQIYYKHDKIPNTKIAQETLNTFNKRSEKEGTHALLHNYLKWKDIFITLSKYFQLVFIYIYIRNIKKAFCICESDLDLWPVMKIDWRSSIIGKSAIHGLINLQLFKNVLADIPIQNQGYYLLENQSWERAFNFAWKKNGHGRLIGVAHSTVRYWDLRYFSDKRSIKAVSKLGNKMPLPDLIALNGPLAIESFTQFGYPFNKTISCEAVRYLNLAKIKTKVNVNLYENKLSVLILGEYIPTGTNKMLDIIVRANQRITKENTYSFKPHPNYFIDIQKYPSLNLSLVTDPLDQILAKYDLVISSNLTSASVDTYLAGIPLIILLDKFELNYSPLRKQTGVKFIYSEEDLIEELNYEYREVQNSNASKSLFFLDTDLPKWKMIFKNRSLTN